MTWDGGKGRLYQCLINLMPPHLTYIEPFLGGGAVMLKKRPAALNIGLDLYERAVDQVACELAPAYLASGDQVSSLLPPVGVAIAVNGGASVSPSVPILANVVTNGDAPARYLFGVVDSLSWLETAAVYSQTLIYADPPYLRETRIQQRPLYRYEFDEADHVRLLSILLSLDCMVMVSGYWSELYADMLVDWNVLSFPSYTRSGRSVDEYVWMNYAKPDRLHDYTFLGDDYRERERITRKKRRWIRILRDMDVLERRAILAAIVDDGLL
jgi:hypothetical protein